MAIRLLTPPHDDEDAECEHPRGTGTGSSSVRSAHVQRDSEDVTSLEDETVGPADDHTGHDGTETGLQRVPVHCVAACRLRI
jgi:hypothetical protein